jgi:hypothetical protein
MRTELRQYVLGREMEGGLSDRLSQFYIAKTLFITFFFRFRLGNECVSPNGVTCVENELKQRLPYVVVLSSPRVYKYLRGRAWKK